MKNALITGATGFIGTKLVDGLLEQGVQVTHIALNDELAHMHDDKGVYGLPCDLKDIASLSSEFEQGSFDVIYHLAWDGVSSDKKDDPEIQLPNINYGLDVCKLAKAIDCGKVIIPGSISEYAYAGASVNGKQPPSPADAYSAAKAATHIICDLYARKNRLGLIWLLIPSIYGPGRSDNNIITYTIQKLLAKEKPSYTKLEQMWEYVYIDDLIRALILVGKKGLPGKTYPIGSGEVKQLKEYVEIMRDAIDTNAELGIGELPYKTATIDNSVVDSTELSKDTGFVAHTLFEQGIKFCIESFKGQ